MYSLSCSSEYTCRDREAALMAHLVSAGQPVQLLLLTDLHAWAQNSGA